MIPIISNLPIDLKLETFYSFFSEKSMLFKERKIKMAVGEEMTMKEKLIDFIGEETTIKEELIDFIHSLTDEECEVIISRMGGSLSPYGDNAQKRR